MWTLLIVMGDVAAEHPLKMASGDNQRSVEALGADGSHPSLGHGVRPGSADRRPDHLDPFGPEDLVERA